MLKELYIRNYAIIDEIRIHFTHHLNIITGETGAGKSILMGALGLILGDRADTSSMLDPAAKCIVEGRFAAATNPAASIFLKEHDLDEEDEIFLRREISGTGKSRAFINDTPVTLTQLRTLSGMLVDLHRQFDIQELNDQEFQLQVLDALASHAELVNSYRREFAAYRSVKAELSALKAQQEAANKEYDYHQFLFNELEEAGFAANEIEELEAESRLMDHAEHVKEVLSAAGYTFSEGEEPLLQQLRQLTAKLGQIGEFVQGLPELEQRIQSCYIELKDVAGEIEMMNTGISFDEERLDEVNTRLDLAYTLLKKHQVQDTAGLLAVQQDLSEKLEQAAGFGIDLERLQAREKELAQSLEKTGKKISENRKKQVAPLTKKVNELLHDVGMPNAAFKIETTSTPLPAENGFDHVEFLFNANKTSFQPIRKVASGGELSRLMLIIKSLVAQSIQLPTLIFDEIDTGISGEAARQVGFIIKGLSEQHQILLITHQAQIAAKAHTHFFVFKESRADKILTGVRVLSREERIQEIATMLSGDKPTAAAFENARELMN